jgi:hypothetical protein
MSAIRVAVSWNFGSYPSPEEMQQFLKVKACELGADATIVTQDARYDYEVRQVTMIGVAIKFRDAGRSDGSAVNPP